MHLTVPHDREAYRPDIDGLRAIAVLLVVAYHAWPAYMPGGYLGVDVFFVISGYLIVGLIERELAAGTFSFAAFYGRRARRILPALLLVVLTALGLGSAVLLAPEFESLGRHAVGAIFFAANFLLLADTGYFDLAAELKPLLHLWSLGIEEQFYLAVPLLLWWASRRRIASLRLVAGIGGVSWLLYAVLDRINPGAAFYLPVSRAWELMAGASLALLQARGTLREPPRVATAAGSLPGAVLVTAGVGLVALWPAATVWAATLVVAGSVLLVGAGPAGAMNRVLATRVLVGIGLISYPLYLWHWVLLSFLRIRVGHDESQPWIPAALAVAIVLAWLTYRVIERPVRRRVPGTAIAVGVAVASVVVAAGTVWVLHGFPGRTDPRLQLRAGFAHSPHEPFREQSCLDTLKDYPALDPDGCRTSSAASPDVLLLGDSHANMYWRSLASQLPARTVLHVGRWSCLPFSAGGHWSDTCRRSALEAQRYIVEHPGIKTVVLAGYWAYLMSGRFADINADYRVPAPVDTALAEQFLASADLVLRPLLASGRRVVLILDNPRLDFSIQRCVLDALPCVLTRSVVEQREAASAAVMERLRLAHPGLGVFDPRSVLCDQQACRVALSGRPLYYDSDHLSVLGADLVVDGLLKSGLVRF